MYCWICIGSIYYLLKFIIITKAKVKYKTLLGLVTFFIAS